MAQSVARWLDCSPDNLPEKVHDGPEEIIEDSELSPGREGPQTHQC